MHVRQDIHVELILMPFEFQSFAVACISMQNFVLEPRASQGIWVWPKLVSISMFTMTACWYVSVSMCQFFNLPVCHCDRVLVFRFIGVRKCIWAKVSLWCHRRVPLKWKPKIRQKLELLSSFSPFYMCRVKPTFHWMLLFFFRLWDTMGGWAGISLYMSAVSWA